MATFRHELGNDRSLAEGPYSAVVSDTSVNVSFNPLAHRIFDILVILIALPSVLPILLLAAIAIKIDDPRGPVIFRHTRYGLNGKPFTIFKLRTMVPDALQRQKDLVDQSIGGTKNFKVMKDPRITRIGRILRKTYLDELPQVFNVLKGDMSIVGPRARSLDPMECEPWQRLRLVVKPGITGVWQITRPRTYDFDEACRMDIDYIRRKSIIGDLRIMLSTVLIMLRGGTGD